MTGSGTPQPFENLLRGGRYASCVHAGGLSCFPFAEAFISYFSFLSLFLKRTFFLSVVFDIVSFHRGHVLNAMNIVQSLQQY